MGTSYRSLAKSANVLIKLRELSASNKEPGNPLTLQEIADHCGVTQQAIRYIEQKALFRLRKLLSEEGIKELEK